MWGPRYRPGAGPDASGGFRGQAGGVSGVPRIVVHPPAPSGGRRVSIGAESLGVAYGVVDLLEFLVRAGISADVPLDDPEVIDWRGGGPGIWS